MFKKNSAGLKWLDFWWKIKININLKFFEKKTMRSWFFQEVNKSNVGARIVRSKSFVFIYTVVEYLRTISSYPLDLYIFTLSLEQYWFVPSCIIFQKNKGPYKIYNQKNNIWWKSLRIDWIVQVIYSKCSLDFCSIHKIFKVIICSKSSSKGFLFYSSKSVILLMLAS